MFGINYVKYGLIGLAALSLFYAGWSVNGSRWEAKYAALTQAHQEEALLAQKKARATEQALQATIDRERVTNEAKIRTINTQLVAALDELRHRPTRTSVVYSKSPCDCPGARGSELFREDASFLVREAARADRLAESLKACYAAYDAVRNTLNKE